MGADGELLLIRINPDQDGKFGFNVKVSVVCDYYLCLCVMTKFFFNDCTACYLFLNGGLF